MNEPFLAFTLFYALSQPMPSPDHLAYVKGLGHDDYLVRVENDEKLSRLNALACPALRVGMRDADLEIRVRCKRLLERACRSEMESYGVCPWIDSFWLYEDTLQHASGMDMTPEGEFFRKYHHHLEKQGWAGQGFPFEKYRLATREVVLEWVVEGMPRWWIEARLDRARQVEKRWRLKYHMQEPEQVAPPAPVP